MPVPILGEKLARKETQAQMLERVQKSAVTIFHVTEGGESVFCGSGWVAEGGKIITNRHVAPALGLIQRIRFASGKEVEVVTQYVDAKRDMAILMPLKNIDLPDPLKFADPKSLERGQAVWAVGTPIDPIFEGSTPGGIIIKLPEEGRLEEPDEVAEMRNTLKTDITSIKGMSGGPVVNERGQVVGMTTGYVHDGQNSFSYSVPVNEMQTAIEHADLFSEFQLRTQHISDLRSANNLPEQIRGNGYVGISDMVLVSFVELVNKNTAGQKHSQKVKLANELLADKGMLAMIRQTISANKRIPPEQVKEINRSWEQVLGFTLFPQTKKQEEIEEMPKAA